MHHINVLAAHDGHLSRIMTIPPNTAAAITFSLGLYIRAEPSTLYTRGQVFVEQFNPYMSNDPCHLTKSLKLGGNWI